MDALFQEALINIAEYAPAVGVLIWLVWRADTRAQECQDKLFEHLDREH